MSQSILFYSNFHDYSKKTFTLSNQKKLDLMYVCVDDPNINLPTFVQAVPLLYITSQKRIIVDEGVEMWINTQNNVSQTNEPSMNQSANTSEIDYEQIKAPKGELSDNFTGGSSFSSNFSSLEETDGDLSGGCGFYNMNSPLESIYTPSDTNKSSNNTNQMFEEYSKSRMNDLKSL